MTTIQKTIVLAACAACCSLPAAAQPLAKPLADFDKLVAELNAANLVGEPIRAGQTTVVPFASIQFGLGAGGVMEGFGGGMGAKTAPLGIVIVEGDDVRVELLPRQEQKPTALMQQLIQGIIDRKVVFMGNGVNLGSATGTVADLQPMLNGMMGKTTMIGNALNVGNLKPPQVQPADAEAAIAGLEAAARKSPTADNYFKLGEAWLKSGHKKQAAAAYRKAIELRPGYTEAIQALAALKE